MSAVLPAAAASAAEPAADNGAVVVMYHRFGEPDFPSTNIALEQFERHLQELHKDKYSVLPLPEIVAALRERRPLPERAVAISIDDAYASVYREAWPRLRQAGLPFTLFVATEPLERGLASYMDWAQLRELAASDLVTVGHHGAGHGHMVEQSAERNRADVRRASEAFRRELGRVPELFAHPYGEFGTAVVEVVRAAGFAAAFGQHSGAVARTSDIFALPRFPMNETYGDLDRFRLATNSLPLPTSEVTPADNRLDPEENPPLYGFTVIGNAAENLAALSCYASGRGRVEVHHIAGTRVEVRPRRPFPPGRARINCTMPGPEGRWRWFGKQFYVSER